MESLKFVFKRTYLRKKSPRVRGEPGRDTGP
jgi:hypothetical protein